VPTLCFKADENVFFGVVENAGLKMLEMENAGPNRYTTNSTSVMFNGRRVRSRAGNGSMGHGSMGQMGHFFGWVTWVMGQCMLTHDPPLFNQPSPDSVHSDFGAL